MRKFTIHLHVHCTKCGSELCSLVDDNEDNISLMAELYTPLYCTDCNDYFILITSVKDMPKYLFDSIDYIKGKN